MAQPLLASTCSHLASMAAAGYRTLVVAGAWGLRGAAVQTYVQYS